MTIKAKLIGNVLVIAAIIIGISLASYFSMMFIRNKLSYLAEKSSPFQIQTVEFQSNLQKCVTDLVSVNAAKDQTEFAAFRAKAVQSLEEVKSSQAALENMSGTTGRFAVYDELNGIARELIANTEAKIASDMAANEANARMSQKMRDATARLKDLDASIRTLQQSYTESFARALKSTERNSAKLRDLEELKSILKELHTVSGSVLTVKNTTAFLIAKGKIRTLMGRIARNRGETGISSKLPALEHDVQELLDLGAAAVSRNDDESRKWASASFDELSETINRMTLELNQDIELASSRLSIETQHQGHIYNRSHEANNILVANSGLIALGLTVTSETNRLFTLTSPEELVSVHSAILATFSTIHDHALSMERSLARIGATDVLRVMESAHSSLESIRSELVSANGIVKKLETRIAAGRFADNSALRLHSVIARQSMKGNEIISGARDDQKNAIDAVNRMIYKGLSQIVGIGTVAILCGILFGIWIYRSVLLPIRFVLDSVRFQQHQGQEKALLVEAVAGGDLNLEVPISEPVQPDTTLISDDEIGKVLNAVVAMSNAQVTLDRAFADMTASLRNNRDEEARRNRIKNGLFDLNIILRDEQDSAALADRTLSFIAGFLGARVGIMYHFDADLEKLHPVATFALSGAGRHHRDFKLGEGLVGQAALERKSICLDAAPPGYLTISSALGSAEPLSILILPIQYNNVLSGVLELGSFTPLCDDDLEFLNQAVEGIAIALNINHNRQVVNDLLAQTQLQAEELQQTNEELEERTQLQAELRRTQGIRVPTP